MANKKALCRNSIPYSPFIGEALGPCCALLIQQIYYWVSEKKHEHNGHYWVYNTYEGWALQLRAYDSKTIRRALIKLRQLGIVVTGNFNSHKYDQTLWYRVDSEKLLGYLSLKFSTWTFWLDPSGQIDQTQMDKMSQPIPKNNSETTAETSLAPQKTNTPTGKVTIVKVSSAKAILEQFQKEKGKISSVTPNSIGSFIKTWQTLVPAHNELVKFVPEFTLAQKGQIGKICKVWGDTSDYTLAHAVKNWIALSKFIAEQNGLKTTPNAPHVGFLLKYAGDARSYMLSSVQLTAKSVPEIHSKAPVLEKLKVAVTLLETEEKPATLEQVMAWKPKK